MAVLVIHKDLFARIFAAKGGSMVGIGNDANGLRGLVATRAAGVGDVLLEVPLSLCASDFGAKETIAVEPPSYARTLPWNVQLACSLVSKVDGLESVLDSFPNDAPLLPIFSCGESELPHACDDGFADEVKVKREWCDEMYASVLSLTDAPVEADAFQTALSLVLSRSLRIRAPAPLGMRRLLVPALDLANHAERASAIYTYAPSHGGVVRLHAARRLEVGDAVTLSYGNDLGSAHYTTYYGFVPSSNAADSVSLRLVDLMRYAPSPLELLQPGGSDASSRSEDGGGGGSDESPLEGSLWWTAERICATGADADALYDLYAAAPSSALLGTMRCLLTSKPIGTASADGYGFGGLIGGFGDGDNAAAAAVLRALACAAEAEARRMEERVTSWVDAEAAAAASSSGQGMALLVELRQSRLALLRGLAPSMRQIASRFEAGAPGIAAGARVMLEAAVMEAEPPPFPVSPRSLEGWSARDWDWNTHKYV